jgi:hypothetical protein
VSKCTDGPGTSVLEKKDESIGKNSIRRRGRRPIIVDCKEAGASGGALGSRGLLLGLAPPNW